MVFVSIVSPSDTNSFKLYMYTHTFVCIVYIDNINRHTNVKGEKFQAVPPLDKELQANNDYRRMKN